MYGASLANISRELSVIQDPGQRYIGVGYVLLRKVAELERSRKSLRLGTARLVRL